MSGYREEDEDAFEWVPENSEQRQARHSRVIATAMAVRLVIIIAIMWWIFGQFSSDLSKLFEMGRTFVLR